MTKPTLITLTAPTAAGKSHLINYIRDVAGLPCLTSTTTRKPRAGEAEGKEYYFISHDESVHLEKEDLFAELAVYRGVRYGVTKEEFDNKLSNYGLAFLIVEPTGIEGYTQYAIDSGANWLKYFVHTDFDIRYDRFVKRLIRDVENGIQLDIDKTEVLSRRTAFEIPYSYRDSRVQSIVKTGMDRLLSMATDESRWFSMVQWDRVLFGTENPEVNLAIILKDLQRINNKV